MSIQHYICDATLTYISTGHIQFTVNMASPVTASSSTFERGKPKSALNKMDRVQKFHSILLTKLISFFVSNYIYFKSRSFKVAGGVIFMSLRQKLAEL